PAALGGLLGTALSVAAFNDRGNPSEEKQIRIGFEIAPVPLNMEGKQPDLVGLGSYIVNTIGNCNDCHTTSPANEYATGGVPFLGQHQKKVNPAAYLAGGRLFGAYPYAARNLTPTKEGLPAGLSEQEFLNAMKTGVDPDKWPPTCTQGVTDHCAAAPIDG